MRYILDNILISLSIKKSCVAKILYISSQTFSLKLRNHKNTYKFFDEDISKIIDIIKEKIIEKETDSKIRKTQKGMLAKQLAETLQNIVIEQAVFSVDDETDNLFAQGKYANYILNLIWLEHMYFKGQYKKKQPSINKHNSPDSPNITSIKINNESRVNIADILSNYIKNSAPIILVIQSNDIAKFDTCEKTSNYN